MTLQKPDRNIGYSLLMIGIVLILIPVIMSLLILIGVMPLPMYVPTPTVTGTDPATELARVWAAAFPLFNIIPTFLLFVVMVYGGSVFMSKGVGLIKEINWRIVQVPEREMNHNVKNAESDPKPTRRAKTAQPEETE